MYNREFYNRSVMINFVIQPTWVTGCLDSWSNIILGMSIRMFLDEINT